MLLPEKEAKYKYCPFLKTHDDKLKFCQGTMCMMWRFEHSDKRSESDKGYCGLAGRPESLS